MKELLQRSLGPSHRIETRFPLALKAIEADANQLEMALLNLTVNARDALDDDGEIIVAAREENIAPGNSSGLKPGPYICLSVIDRGKGMDEVTLRKATEPFLRRRALAKELASVFRWCTKSFAEQSGGRFILQSQQGEGTTAELLLPVAKASMQAVGATGLSQAAPAKKLAPLTILAVDDDALVLMNTVAMLEDLGHTAFEAYSGREALEILQREDSVDLVITDQAMPQMSGTQLAKAIKHEVAGYSRSACDRLSQTVSRETT